MCHQYLCELAVFQPFMESIAAKPADFGYLPGGGRLPEHRGQVA
mgnify:CR=1 FL=1